MSEQSIAQLNACWSKAFDGDVSKVRLLGIDEQQRLIVECANSAWVTQLRLLAGPVLRKLNAYLPEPILTGMRIGLRPVRILVTGSRKWQDMALVGEALEDTWYDASQLYYGHPLVVVHGDQPGCPDTWAKAWAVASGIRQEPHPADWAGACPPECPTEDPEHRKPRVGGGIYCPKAGLRRNLHMVSLGADLCLAFIKARSGGASYTAAQAEAAGIPVRLFTT